MTQNLVPAAFFDVDETIIRINSMRSFLNFYRDYTENLPTGESFITSLPVGAAREDTNRAYYALFEGDSVARIREFASLWYQGISVNTDLYVQPVRTRIEELNAAGTRIVLVSGSFDPLLEPVACELGTTEVLCSQPDFVDDTYLGTLAVPMTGIQKSKAVVRFCNENEIDPANCIAFGDHESDMLMLESVGTGYWVRDTEHLEIHKQLGKII